MQNIHSRQNDGQPAAKARDSQRVGWSLCNWWIRCVWLLAIVVVGAGGVTAAEPDKPKGDLSLQQQQIRRDYERFERSLLEAAENMRRKEPEQSDILDRARQRSQEQALLNEMDKISQELKQNQTGSASERQRQVIGRLKEILQLLQSEDERDRLKREMERIQELLKDTNRVIAKQRDAKAANQKGSDQKKAEDEQKKASDEAQKLANKIDKQDKARQGESKPSEGKQPDSKDSPQDPSGDQPKDGEPKESPEGKQKPGDKQPMDGEKSNDQKPKDSQDKPEGEPPMQSDSSGKEGKDGEKKSKPGKPSKPMDGQESPESQSPPSNKPPMPGSPMPSNPGQQPPSPMDEQESQEPQPPQESDQQTQGREDLKKAQESMQKAIEELEKQSRDAAGQEQERALEELEKLKAKLEEILRQRREEEKELYLAMLEVRFQKMLRLQLQVNAETVRLEKIPVPERNPAHFDKCSEASRQQKENQTEAEKTLNLLKEEGSSVAFPEAVEQLIGDMKAVAGLLGEANTGSTTQLREQMVLETLEEIILSLQKEMEQNRQKKQQQKGQGSPEEEKLVNQLAELKMIRSLQNQVNRVTKLLGAEVEGEQATDKDRRKLAEDIAKRQQRIQSATYDLSTGRNK